MADSDLPQEILIDIFSRLPSKAVGRCRCLSKPWRTLLSSPDFLKSHFTRKPHHQNLILITPSGSTHYIATTNAAAAAASRNLDFPINISEIGGCSDGLVLLVDDEQGKFLVNPITLQQVKIPNSPLALKADESSSLHGFGYDRSSNDYKIVTISYYNPNYGGDEEESDGDDLYVDVYSVKRGVWVRVDSSPYDHAVPYASSGAYVNGAIHWLASDTASGHPSRSVIAAFDFVDEVFDEIPAPSDLDVEQFVFNRLVVLGGCLCMFDTRSDRQRSSIWIMKEHGVGDSWTRIIVDADYEWDILKPLCFIGDEEIVLLSEVETLIIYNLKERTLRDMLIDGVPAGYMDGGVFVESLVSPVEGRV